MTSEFGGDFISITDEEGNAFELELLDVLEHNGTFYHAFLPADASEDDEDLEIVLLKSVEENGEELLATLDTDEEINEIYELFMDRLFEEEDEA